MRKNNDAELNLASLFVGLMKRAWVIILCALLFGGAFFGAARYFLAEEYEISVCMYVSNMTKTPHTNVDNISYSDISASIMLTNTYITIVESDTVLDAVIEDAKLNYTRKELSEMLNVSALNDTEVLEISITDTDPKEAAVIAESFTKVATRKLADIVEGSSVKILSAIEAPTEPSGPSYLKISILGALLGAVLSSGLILLGMIFDTEIRSEKDLEQWDYPVLGSVPDLASARGRGYARRPDKQSN